MPSHKRWARNSVHTTVVKWELNCNVLYMDMNLFPWYSQHTCTCSGVCVRFFFFYFVICALFISLNLFCVHLRVSVCMCAAFGWTLRYFGTTSTKRYVTMWWQMNGVLCLRFPVHDTTALKFNFKPLSSTLHNAVGRSVFAVAFHHNYMLYSAQWKSTKWCEWSDQPTNQPTKIKEAIVCAPFVERSIDMLQSQSFFFSKKKKKLEWIYQTNILFQVFKYFSFVVCMKNCINVVAVAIIVDLGTKCINDTMK